MAHGTVTYLDLKKEVGRFAGYGEGVVTAWTSAQEADVIRCALESIRRLSFPNMLPGQREPHVWSHLKPYHTLNAWATATGTLSGAPVAAGDNSVVTALTGTFVVGMEGTALVVGSNSYTIKTFTSATVCTVLGDATGEASAAAWTVTADGNYGLPFNYASMESPLTFGANQGYCDMHLGSVSSILRWRQHGTNTGFPRIAAVRTKANDIENEQRSELMLEPIPDQDYALTFQYSIAPDVIERETDILIESHKLGHVYLQSGRAVVEHWLNDNSTQTEQGIFMQMLQAAVANDLQRQPDRLGKGYSHRHPLHPQPGNRGSETVTYNSVTI